MLKVSAFDLMLKNITRCYQMKHPVFVKSLTFVQIPHSA